MLTTEEFGQLSIYNNTITFASTIFYNFIIQSFLRYYYNYNSKSEKKYFKRSYVTYLFIMFFVSSIALIIFNFILGFSNKVIFLIIINSFFLSVFNLQLNDFRCEGELNKYNLYKVLNSVFKIAIIFAMYSVSNTSISYLIATVLSFSLLCTSYIFKNGKFNFDKKLFNNTIKFGLPLVGTSLGYLLLSTFDRYMISFIRGNVEVAYYSFAYQISELSLVNVNTLLMVIFYPAIIKEYDANGKKTTESLIGKLFNYHMIIVFSMAILLIIFSKDLTHLFFKKYIGTENYIVLIVIGVFIYCTSFYTNKAFEVKKKTNELLYITSISAFINILLNLVFIPIYGAIAATVTTSVSYLIYIALSIYKGRKYLNIKFDKKVLLYVIIVNIIAFTFSVIISYVTVDINIKNTVIKFWGVLLIYTISFVCIKTKGIFKEKS
ncbi:Polysaccharide biosynthesis protein [Clostridium paraputrificum]|uniref:Polysaccharide biosynthesis protein n=2 Tax=Clostridium paraputrificum TaxID=29363 RepID=A0A6N3DMB2_9CLOT